MVENEYCMQDFRLAVENIYTKERTRPSGPLILLTALFCQVGYPVVGSAVGDRRVGVCCFYSACRADTSHLFFSVPGYEIVQLAADHSFFRYYPTKHNFLSAATRPGVGRIL